MSIVVTEKKFLLAGYEIVVDLNKGFAKEIAWLHAELERSLERIGEKAEPVRFYGFWQPRQAFITVHDSDYASLVKYFFGVEVLGLEGVPSDCVVKVLQSSAYAVYREERRGTAPKADMYAVPGYQINFDIAGDLEIFDDFDHLGEHHACDILVPLKRNAST